VTAHQPKKSHPWRKQAPRWSHNVQHIRLAFPPFLDETHHQKLVALHADLIELLAKHDLPTEPSYIGFYRANADWDNTETTMRGANSDGVDNAP